MKKIIGFIILYAFIFVGSGQQSTVQGEIMKQEEQLILTIGEQEFVASLEDNNTTRAFVKMLPLTLNMSDYNRNEKVIGLSEPIRSDSASYPGTVYVGDIMCYSNDSLVIFYDTFSSSFSYVKMGHIEDVEGYVEALGSKDVEVTFSVR